VSNDTLNSNFYFIAKVRIDAKARIIRKWFLQHTLLHALRRLDFPTLGRPTIAICQISKEECHQIKIINIIDRYCIY
jgi:hypothetical protein